MINLNAIKIYVSIVMGIVGTYLAEISVLLKAYSPFSWFFCGLLCFSIMLWGLSRLISFSKKILRKKESLIDWEEWKIRHDRAAFEIAKCDKKTAYTYNSAQDKLQSTINSHDYLEKKILILLGYLISISTFII